MSHLFITPPPYCADGAAFAADYAAAAFRHAAAITLFAIICHDIALADTLRRADVSLFSLFCRVYDAFSFEILK